MYDLYLNDIVKDHPADKAAFIFKDQVTTYGQFRQNVEAKAAFLQARGIREGDRVGLELRVALDSGVNIRTTCANLQHQVRYRVQQECGVEVGRIDIIVETVKA